MSEKKTRSASGLGAIFANVRATAKTGPFEHLEYDDQLVVTCRSCGAPKERVADFRCQYCKAPLLEAKDEEK